MDIGPNCQYDPQNASVPHGTGAQLDGRRWFSSGVHTCTTHRQASAALSIQASRATPESSCAPSMHMPKSPSNRLSSSACWSLVIVISLVVCPWNAPRSAVRVVGGATPPRHPFAALLWPFPPFPRLVRFRSPCLGRSWPTLRSVQNYRLKFRRLRRRNCSR